MTNFVQPSDQTCACGSGLRRERCCALDWSRSWAHQAPADIAGQARAAFAKGDTRAAERHLIRAIEAAPKDAGALRALYDLRANANPSAAAALLIRIVRLEPDNPALQALLGRRLTDTYRPHQGEPHLRRALALSAKPDPALLSDLAWNLRGQGRMEEARRLFQQAHVLDPSSFNTVYGWARMEEADRRYEAAGQLLDIGERLAPGNPHIALQRALLMARTGADEEARSALETLQARADPKDIGLRLDILNERGAVLDRLDRHAEAFAVFAEAKQAMLDLTGQAYLAGDAAEQARRLKSVFVRERMASMPRAGVRSDVPQPIFIVGFPRSGTTMIEQTLSAHPRVRAGDELPILGELTEAIQALTGAALPYPEAMSGVSRQDLDLLRDHYLDRAREFRLLEPGADGFTDKMPLNETHMGLISLIFPAAPIIHLTRHPLDVALSTFANQMTHGFYCAGSLDGIARHFMLTLDLVDHYRAQISPRYLAIRYEDVIADQEARVREMLTFIGADYDPRCLAFHENRRYARTASYAQVTEKLHDRSRYRWRGYREQLAPIIPVLEPAIRRLGYDLD